MIIIDIPFKPVPWKAHAGSGKRSFNPLHQVVKNYQLEIKEQYSGELLKDAVSIDYIFYFACPRSWSHKKTEKALRGEIRPTSRPDTTNLIKFCEDTLKLTVLVDDSIVVRESGEKYYSTKEHTLIKINLIDTM